MTAPVRLWYALRVVDFEETVAFYRDTLRLPIVDGWHDDRSRGVVFAIGESARVEIESASTPSRPAHIALELPDRHVLEALAVNIGGAISKHSRGHHGFTTFDPSGTEIYLWSEK
jgi:predicted enzyme related to lactoylglutathione lyase